MLMQRVLWILWPAFLMACGAEMVFFALIDPHDIHFYGEPLEVGRMTVYAVGFFFFWVLGAGSSALTTLLSRSPWEVNRCPLPIEGRPPGCPKGDDPGACCGPEPS